MNVNYNTEYKSEALRYRIICKGSLQSNPGHQVQFNLLGNC